jgi:hypothetical protein
MTDIRKLTEATEQYSQSVVAAPCGKRVKVPAHTIQGEWVLCAACGSAHKVARKQNGRVTLRDN